MTELNHRVSQDMPSMTACRKEMNELNPNVCHRLPHVAKEMIELNHSVSQEMLSMTTSRQEMDELNHNLCHSPPHVAKEMTELNPNVTSSPRRVHIKPYSPSL